MGIKVNGSCKQIFFDLKLLVNYKTMYLFSFHLKAQQATKDREFIR